MKWLNLKSKKSRKETHVEKLKRLKSASELLSSYKTSTPTNWDTYVTQFHITPNSTEKLTMSDYWEPTSTTSFSSFSDGSEFSYYSVPVWNNKKEDEIEENEKDVEFEDL